MAIALPGLIGFLIIYIPYIFRRGPPGGAEADIFQHDLIKKYHGQNDHHKNFYVHFSVSRF